MKSILNYKPFDSKMSKNKYNLLNTFEKISKIKQIGMRVDFGNGIDTLSFSNRMFNFRTNVILKPYKSYADKVELSYLDEDSNKQSILDLNYHYVLFYDDVSNIEKKGIFTKISLYKYEDLDKLNINRYNFSYSYGYGYVLDYHTPYITSINLYDNSNTHQYLCLKDFKPQIYNII